MTYYEILNIKQTASAKDIKNAYRFLAKKYHPDTYQGNKTVAEEKMKQINEAYDVLSSKELKEKYDEQFKVAKTEVKKESTYHKSYYNYETEEYKSPDPRDADYRSYYNYSGDYEYEPEYDFSKLKNLFEGSVLKIVFLIIGIVAVLVFLIFMINQIRIQAMSIFEYTVPVKEPHIIESVPQNNYHNEEEMKSKVPEIKDEKEIELNIPQINSEEIDNQIKEWEQNFNNWYETEGKVYEQQIKEELNSLYQEFLNSVNNN